MRLATRRLSAFRQGLKSFSKFSLRSKESLLWRGFAAHGIACPKWNRLRLPDSGMWYGKLRRRHARRRPLLMCCPECTSERIHLSRRRGLLEKLSFLCCLSGPSGVSGAIVVSTAGQMPPISRLRVPPRPTRQNSPRHLSCVCWPAAVVRDLQTPDATLTLATFCMEQASAHCRRIIGK